VINESPVALQLRYLQTLTHISAEKNSTIVFPIPGKIRFFLSLRFFLLILYFSRTFEINENSKGFACNYRLIRTNSVIVHINI
jgi:hypothetical protein